MRRAGGVRGGRVDLSVGITIYSGALIHFRI